MRAPLLATSACLWARRLALEAVGLGGVGKTQLAIEYCYRQYQAMAFGLVIWVNAESAESCAADFRKLAVDTGLEVQGKENDEVVALIQARLFRCHCAWLVVFDNLERHSLLREYMPRGSMHRGTF